LTKRQTNWPGSCSFTDSELRFKNSPDEFSALENVCHLRDLEVAGYAARIRQMIEEANPTLADFDGARVAAESEYNNEQAELALESFSRARKGNVALFRNLSDDELQRQGELAGVGRITLQRLAEMMSEHDEGHLDEVRALRQQLEVSQIDRR
jgi:hypothetical protein